MIKLFAFFNGVRNVCSRASIIRISKCFHYQVILLDGIALEKYLKMSAFIECSVLQLLIERVKKRLFRVKK